MFNGNEIMMVTTALETHIGHLTNLRGATNDTSFVGELDIDIADYQALHGKVLRDTKTDGEEVFYDAFVVKAKPLESDAHLGDIIAIYSNEEAAMEHVAAFKGIYKTDLTSHLWYEPFSVRSEFSPV